MNEFALKIVVTLATALILTTSAAVSQEEPASKPSEAQAAAQPPADPAPPQAEDPLKGLKRAEAGDLPKDKQIMLNPDVTPVYSAEGKRLVGAEFMQAIISGGFVPEAYIDENKEIKAFALRPATEEEKKQIRSMMEGGEGEEAVPVGADARPFSVTDLKGKKYSLDKLKGKIVVINFWFMECRPCRMEIPELNKVVDKYKGKDVVFLGMSTNRASQLENFLLKNEFKYTVIPDSSAVAGSYRVTGFPTHVVIDRNSKIAYFATGFGPGSVDRLSGEIEKLVKK